MPTSRDVPRRSVDHLEAPAVNGGKASRRSDIGLLSGCQDRPYVTELALALVSLAWRVDLVGGDEMESPELHATPNLRFVNIRGRQDPKRSALAKLSELAAYYIRLLYYVTFGPKILHILWNSKLEYFDRTLLMLYLKLIGKKITLTAHNVNQARRDSRDSALNRMTLRMQYRLVDHIFVHTAKMKSELRDEFGVPDKAVTVLRHPINNAFPDTALTPSEAKRRLGLAEQEKAVLFFGRVRPYKGLDYLLAAVERLVKSDQSYRLIIAGEPKKGSEGYTDKITATLEQSFSPGQVIAKMQFIPDEDAELYLKAADVMVLPYKDIFQSGVLFLGYSYGLPVIATDVGAFREEIVEGQTGFLCPRCESGALAETIEQYFGSDLYRYLSTNRARIKEYARVNHSWSAVGQLTAKAYAQLSERQPA
jgi:D-inositol-3-phosphate glycosyltransferase